MHLSGFAFILLMGYIGMVLPQPMLKSKRCDDRKILIVESDCMSCAVSGKYSCPKGSMKKTYGRGKAGCSYTVNMGGVVLSMQGCSHTCQTLSIEPKCCKGFWGTVCTECPGSSSNPCNNHGTCMDGLQGNGTCICNEGFTGFSCNECSDPSLYGANCNSACHCKHGICKSGLSGDGSCTCEAGYMGLTCEQESLSCSKNNCGSNSRCVESGGLLKCDCMPGYYKKEYVCEAKDPCRPSPCSPYATCKSSGPRQYTCACKNDYYGDGKTCLPVNPCSVNNGGCLENSTKCVYRSPGKSYCSCLPGMISRNVSMGCYIPNVCRISTCGKSAQCEAVSPGVHKCACHEGEISDGRNCYGSILYEIQKLNIEDSQMRKQPGAIRIFEEGCGLTLRKYGPFTVFVPLLTPTHMDETEAKQICKAHIIPGQYLASDLKEMSKLWTISGELLEFPQQVGFKQEFFKDTESDKKYKLMKTDLPATNGIFHVIDQPITTNNMEIIGNPQMTIGEILATKEIFSRYETMLENCGLPPILNRPGSFTVFVPSNKAVDSLRDGKLIYLFTEAKHKLLELVKYHISSVAAVTVDRLISMSHILTSSNEIIKINVTENGRILFGNPGIPLVQSDIVASNGVIHLLDGIFIPSTILPILPARCNETVEEIKQGTCSPCDSVLPCPDGSIDTRVNATGCLFEDHGNITKGCARNCRHHVIVNGCCGGFYGPDCRPCPGGFSNPCYGRGSCNDGIGGNGKCMCFSKYKGVACHICTDPNKHGDDCEEDCRCVHGVCDNRPGSRGVCQGGRCNKGYIGEFCDQGAEPCASLNMTQYCHINAVCLSTENVTSCLCGYGYEGDGSFCQPADECKKSDRGGCSDNAICTNAPTGGVTCQCNPGWSGDGIECIPIDNCVMENRGNCDVNADCKFTQPGENDCICKKGYTGDGYSCDPVDVCSESNGGCHQMATCMPTSGGQRTCICPGGFAGDGLSCYADVLMELLSIPDVSIFNGWIKNSQVSISLSSNVTALVPTDAAIGALPESTKKFWLDKLPFLVRAHFLRGAFTSEQLKQHIGQELDTIDPRTKLEIGTMNGNITVNKAKILVHNIPASNGYIFIINQVLTPPLGAVPPARPGLYQALDRVPAFEQFKQAIQKNGLIQEIESSRQKYTILVPSNSAVTGFYNQSELTSLENSTIQYHVILGEKLAPSDIRDGMHRSSMLGMSYWLMFYKSYNQTFVHDVPLDGSFFETDNGMLMGISEVLKILKNRCDITRSIVNKTKCGPCNAGIRCPEGTVLQEPLGIGSGLCAYKRRSRATFGCRFSCVSFTTDLQCCEGFYGHQCLACPGGLNNTCSKNGICIDRIYGIGDCICKEGFHGTACETCEAGKYGKDCQTECDCIHGICNDGLHGDGFCHCDKGWTGFACDIDIKKDLCNGSCSIYANCIADTTDSAVRCSCIAGYVGNGTHCTETDPCTVNNGGCSKYAKCAKAPFGLARCTCFDDYTGDGLHCYEIDPCVRRYTVCHMYAECIKTGPNKAACICRPGFEGNGTHCKAIDICKENNGGCSPYAICRNYGPSRRFCHCNTGFFGDGIICEGKIIQVIHYDTEANRFGSLLERNIYDLSEEGPFTVFAPENQVIENHTTIEDWTRKNITAHLLRYHLVGCQKLLFDDLQNISSLTTISGGTIRLSIKNGEVYLNDFARITKSDKMAKNGVFHIIDQVLIPEVPINGSENLNISEAAELYGYSKFIQLLQTANLMPVVQDKIHQPITVLWPTDKAFDSLPKEQKKWLYHEDHKDKLEAYLKFHIIRGTMISSSRLPEIKSQRTLYGSTISFQCSSTKKGDIFVNDNNAKIIQRDMRFIGGIAHGIDQVLEPPNLGAHCDEFTATIMPLNRFHCTFCGMERPCPPGSIDKGETENCSATLYDEDFHMVYYRNYRTLSLRCRRKCYTMNWFPRCCKNHYGGDCHVCPGGLQAPCSNHGTCADGMAGNGKCSCSLGFSGTACEICASNRYGPNCTECTCSKNGQCNDGISGDGSCFCTEGWSGQKCEIKLATTPVCSPKCDANATCRVNNQCECNLFYEGDGRTCSVIDQCGAYNGGCSIHAKCSQFGTKISCECFPEYEGDGFVCTPINLCANGENGGCSEHATCIYTGPKTRRCECHEGYVGNGVQCLEKAIPPVDRCLEQNGECDSLATCSDLHFEEKTAGVFHLQSPKGKYKYTYEEAESACASEGASIATFQQLSAAQQLGYHRCLVGWLYNRTAGYPTVYPSANCGSNHVGIVDYSQRVKKGDTWDVYCYRLQDTRCECPDGYIGDGSFCNGNLLQVLEANPKLSKFYSMVLDYGLINSQGSVFVDILSNRTSYKTLFVPDDNSLDDNVTLTWRDLEHHLSKLDILVPYTNLTHGSTVLSNLGYNLSISHTNCSTDLCPKVVNENVILHWDIPAFNGIIHIIKGPLIAPPMQDITDSQISHPVSTALVTVLILLTVAAAAAGYIYYRKNPRRFNFRKLKEEEDNELNVQNPPLVTIPNPVYGGSRAFLAQPDDPYNNEYDSSDDCTILH
ncbi:stabilin-1 [Bufo gargarizans]|uniref:stabilin-1 n=1 Tax=Bufo gargarizans TaxID=30331 RepID=UPI001CF5A2C9|nr:stabilin-1 [Bufo gargarizans]